MEKDRTTGAVFTLGVGLALNISLGVAKLVAGILARSASVTSDGVNNLSDAAVSVVTMMAFLLAARGADREHPYGHGRYEYIATFVLGAMILVVGAEVFVGGLRRAITPVNVEAGLAVWITLGASVAVKSFMAVFYRVRAAIVGSQAVRAASVDSMSDAAVTTVVLVCSIVELKTGAHIDGYVSMAVAVVIVIFAIGILRRTVSRLLGERPDPELYDSIVGILTANSSVVSVHDLFINDYGENNKLAEADVVLPADMSFVEVHAVCDRLEREVLQKTGVRMCLHADPQAAAGGREDEIRRLVEDALGAFGASVHDIFVDDDAGEVRLDVKLAQDAPYDKVVAQAEAAVHTALQYAVHIDVDYI